MSVKYKVFDKELQAWLRWGYADNAPGIPLVPTGSESAASLFTEIDVERLKRIGLELGIDPNTRFDFHRQKGH